jgi:DNA-binding transcriptional MerR regulator
MTNCERIDAYLSRIGDLGNLGASGGDGASVPLPKKLYRVSEIADHLGLTRQTLHNYATIGLITEERRTDGGQRLFDESVFGRLAVIQRLKRTHRLHEIRRILDEGRPLPADAAPGEEAAGPRPPRTNLERMQELAAAAHLRDEVETALRPPAPAARQQPSSSPGAARAAKADAGLNTSISSIAFSGDAVAGPDFAVRASQDESTPDHEKQAPTDDKARS